MRYQPSKQTSVDLQDLSWRRLQHNNQRNNISPSITSWRRLEVVLQIHLEDLLKTSSRHLTRRLEDVLGDKKLLHWRRLEDVLKTCLEDRSWRHVLKTCLKGVLKTCPQEVLKTSWRCLGYKQNVYWWYLYLTMDY